jgi:hypothetical protein
MVGLGLCAVLRAQTASVRVILQEFRSKTLSCRFGRCLQVVVPRLLAARCQRAAEDCLAAASQHNMIVCRINSLYNRR